MLSTIRHEGFRTNFLNDPTTVVFNRQFYEIGDLYFDGTSTHATTVTSDWLYKTRSFSSVLSLSWDFADRYSRIKVHEDGTYTLKENKDV